MINKSDFNGLARVAEGYEPFEVVGSKRDPGYGYEHVHMLFVRFPDGANGLAIYDTAKEEFIEEPADLADYYMTPEKIKQKYGFDFAV